MEVKNYYQVLGLNQDASTEDIKKAFRRLALRCHPDHNPVNIQEATEKFKEINEAFQVLGDEHKRRQYNRLINLSGYRWSGVGMESNSNDITDYEMLREMLQKLANMGFYDNGIGWEKPWGCGRRQGGQCRRQWRRDIDH